jgi:ankyrin repeat protein
MTLRSIIDPKKRAKVREALKKNRPSLLKAKKGKPAEKPLVEEPRKAKSDDTTKAARKKIVRKQAPAPKPKPAPAKPAAITRVAIGKTRHPEQVLLDAAEKGDLTTVKLALRNGARINTKDNKGKTALWIAASHGYVNVFRYLVKKKADINMADSKCWTPLMIASKYGHSSIAFELASILKADLNAKAKTGSTALIIAISNKQRDIAKMLIKEGANLDARDFQTTALGYAVDEQDEELIKLLINAGADVDSRNTGNMTPLMWTIYHGNLDMVKLLVSAGADVNAKNGDVSVLKTAYIPGDKKIIRFLKKHGAKL